MTDQEPIPFNSIEDLPRNETVLVYVSGEEYDCWMTAERGDNRNIKTYPFDAHSHLMYLITHWLPMPPAPPKPLDDAEAFRQLCWRITASTGQDFGGAEVEISLNTKIPRQLYNYLINRSSELRSEQIKTQFEKEYPDKKVEIESYTVKGF